VREWSRKESSSKADEAVAKSPPYDVVEFSMKHGLSIFDARRLLRETRTREEADAAALKEKARNSVKSTRETG
jgi:hypothetical protein